jgi:hypothetical protein
MKLLRKLFGLLVDNGLFDGIEKVVLLGGHEVKIHKTADGGLTIYSDYSENQVMLSVHRYGKDHVGMGFPVADGTNHVRLAEDVMRAALKKLITGELTPHPICVDGSRNTQKEHEMYSSEIERMFKQATSNGLFKRDYPVLAVIREYWVLIKASSSEGIEIYTDYPKIKVFAVLHDGATLEGFGKGFTAVGLRQVMRALVERTALDNLVIDHTNGPSVPLSRNRFREICNQSRIKPIGRFGFHMGAVGYMPERRPKTLDQWFKSKSNG